MDASAEVSFEERERPVRGVFLVYLWQRRNVHQLAGLNDEYIENQDDKGNTEKQIRVPLIFL